MPDTQQDRISRIRQMQTHLQELGFNLGGDAAGSFREGTRDALAEFQQRYNRYQEQGETRPGEPLATDGKLDSRTEAALRESTESSRLNERFNDGRVLKLGHEGGEVTEWQRKLWRMGYIDEVTGIYNERFAEAVKSFQRDHIDERGSVDGEIGPSTRSMIEARHLLHRHRSAEHERHAALGGTEQGAQLAQVDPAILRQAEQNAALSMDTNREGMQNAIRALSGDHQLTATLAGMGGSGEILPDQPVSVPVAGSQPRPAQEGRMA